MFNRLKSWLQRRFLNYVDAKLPTPHQYLEQPSGLSMASFIDSERRIIGYSFVVPWELDFTYDADEYDQEVLESERETISDFAEWLEVIARLSEAPRKEMMN